MSRKQEVVIRVRAMGALGVTETCKYYHPTGAKRLRIKSLDFMPDLAVTAAATHFTTFTAENTTKSQSFHSRATDVAGGSLVAGTKIAVTLPTDPSKCIIEPGDTLTHAKTDSGNGVAAAGSYVYLCEEWN